MIRFCERHHEMRPSSSLRGLFSAVMLAGGLLWAAAGALAHSVTLEWDRNPESNITGYRLYQGSSSRSYSSGVNVGNQTRFTVNDLVEGRTYYFAVTASNPYGESGYSNELKYTVPRASQGGEPQDQGTQDQGSGDQQPQVRNLLFNPGFENGTDSWTFFTNGKGGFTTVSPGAEGSKAGRVAVTTTGTNTQLYQQGVRLDPYTDYELTFTARSSSGNDLKISVLKHASPYTNYGLSKRVVDLGASWQSFKITFKTTGFSTPVSDARLMFWFSDTAAGGDQFFIDGIVLAKKGSQPVSSTQTAAAAPQDDTLTSNPPAEAADVGRIVSDDFNSCGLEGGWSFVNPLGDGSYALDGVGTGEARLLLSVPAGTSHDPWTTNPTVRLMQAAEDLDFEIEVKFESLPTRKYQMQGVMVEQDAGNWIRFDFYHDGLKLRVFAAAGTDGVPTAVIDQAMATGPALFMRVRREGDLWTQRYSPDGKNWVTSGSFMHPLRVTAVGPFVGNHGSSGAIPAYTAVVDYFFHVDDPIIPEDVGSPAPETLITSVVGAGSVTVDPSQTSYCTDQVVTLEAVPSPGRRFTGWSGDVTGTRNPVTVTMNGKKSAVAVFSESGDGP